jgi:hypothetical protein
VKYKKILISGTILQHKQIKWEKRSVNMTSRLQMDGCKVSENRHNIVFLDVCGESGE